MTGDLSFVACPRRSMEEKLFMVMPTDVLWLVLVSAVTLGPAAGTEPAAIRSSSWPEPAAATAE